jgi:hypothetical protein
MSDIIKPSDPILDELHAFRQQMLAECDGSLESLVDRLNRVGRESQPGLATPTIYTDSTLEQSPNASSS